MKTKAISCFLVMLCSFCTLFAQQQTKEHYFKIYAQLESFNFRLTNGNDTLLIEEKDNSFYFGGFSPAFSWQKENGNFQEVELSQLLFLKEDEVVFFQNVSSTVTEPIRGMRTTAIGFALRYEYNWSLAKNQNQLQPYIGLGSLLLLKVEDFIPKTSAGFPNHSFNLSNRFVVSPRVIYHLGQRFILDLNASLPLIEIGWKKNRADNPLLSEIQRTQNTFGLDFLPKIFQLRIGFGVKI